MGRRPRPLDPLSGPLGRFAAQLRELREEAGNPTYREMAARVYFSRTALADAAGGRSLPSVAVVRAYAEACGGEPEQWAKRWHEVRDGLQLAESPTCGSASPWPVVEAADGVDPDEAGCTPDAVTVLARRLALSHNRVIVGEVQLRYSARIGAVWSRFHGFHSLDHLAHSRRTEIEVQVCRPADGAAQTDRADYVFDYHWCNLLRSGRGAIVARAAVLFDGDPVGTAGTDQVALP
jgi:transcriptional regulator with XRE-family HTH domain